MNRYTTIARSGRVPASPAQIIGLVSTTAGFTAINPHLTQDPKLEITPVGPASGVGSGFGFRGKNGKGVQTVNTVTHSAVDFDIDMGRMGRSIQQIHVTPADGESIVEWSMTLDAGANPLLRLFGLLAGKIVGPAIETGISNLNAHDWSAQPVAAPVTPVH